MTERTEDSVDHPSTTRQSIHAPLVGVVPGFMAGILLDRWLDWPMAAWTAFGLVSIAAWLACFLLRRDLAAAGWLIVSFLACGGLRHHQSYSAVEDHEIALFAREESRPARLVGQLSEEPETRTRRDEMLRSAWPRQDMTRCTLHCEALRTPDGEISVSGAVRMTVTGRLSGLRAGDRLIVSGWLARPRRPSNPGEFDFREHLRRSGIHAVLYVGHPEAVVVVEPAAPWGVTPIIDGLRRRALDAIQRHVRPRQSGVAAALLLGDRSNLPNETRTAFVESGMMHVLAISGLHVGILAALVYLVCRLINLSPLSTSAVVLAAVIGYGIVAHNAPPILRATVFITIVAAGRPWYRTASDANLLALAALAVLLANPTDLLDTGAQLSFLAVAAIMLWRRIVARPGASTAADSETGIKRALRRLGARAWRRIASAYTLTGLIWLFVTPLIAASFHVVSLSGIVLNVLLVPLVVLTMWAGFIFFAAAMVAGPVAAIPGWMFDRLLSGMLSIVEAATHVDLGHRYVAGPSAWWLCGFYALVAALICLPLSFRYRRWMWASLTGWTAIGLAAPFLSSRPHELTCTFLSVGHGCAILVETPEGKTLLYDAGALDDSRRAARAVLSTLWHRGHNRLDTILLSHADLDHFNAVPELAATVPVGCVLLTPAFLHADQPEPAIVCNTVAGAGVPIRTIGADDRLSLDPSCEIRIRQPRPREHFDSDNASSVVLTIEYAGRRILLTGDLVDDGLEHLLAGPPLAADVLLAPHHGSLAANPRELAEWAQPQIVVVSGGRIAPVDQLAAVYGDAVSVLSTARSGAVTIAIGQDGSLRCTPFR